MAKRYDLGSVIGKILFNYDETGTNKAKQGLKDTENESDKFTDKLDKNSKKGVESLARVAKGFAVAAASAAALNGAANLVVGLATELTHLSGVAALLPAGLLAGAAAIGTLTLGMSGFKEALADAGDAQKFNDDLKNLAPNAQGAARAFQSLRPQLIGLRLSVQNALFDDMGSTISRLARSYVPLLRTQLTGMAGALNQGAHQFAAFGEDSHTISDLRSSLNNDRLAVDNLTKGIHPMLNALRDVGTVGSTFLPELANDAARLAQRFADWIAEARKSGKLKEWIQQGLDTLHQLFTIISNIVQIAYKFFTAFSTGGAGLFNTLERVTTQLNMFLSSAQGQQVLKNLGTVMGAIGTVVQNVLLVALKQLAPILNTALPPFKQLVQQIGPVLIQILSVVGPLLQHIAQFWADNATTINPLLLQLAAAILAFRGMYGIIKSVNGVVNGFKDGFELLRGIGQTSVLVGTFITNMGGAVVSGITTGITATWNFIAAMGRMALSVAINAGQMILSFGQAMVAMAVQIGGWVAAQAVALAKNAVQWALSMVQFAGVIARYVAGWAVMAATAVADAAVMAAAWIAANPWVLVIAAIALVVAYIITHWTQIKNFMQGIWNAITGAVRAAWNAIPTWIRNAISAVFALLTGDVGRFVEIGGYFIRGIWDGAVAMWNNFIGWVKNAAGQVAGFFKSILGIHSPSKVMMEIGHNVTEGLTIGIQNGAKQDIPPAVTAMAGAVTQPMVANASMAASAAANGPLGGTIGGTSVGASIQELHLHIAGNLDPTNPVAWRKAVVNIRDGIRQVERSNR